MSISLDVIHDANLPEAAVLLVVLPVYACNMVVITKCTLHRQCLMCLLTHIISDT